MTIRTIRTPVGSGTGAVIRRQLLGCGRGFPLRARVEAAVIPSPVPAASHAACGFPALRAPASVRAEGYEAVPSGAAAARPVSRRPGMVAPLSPVALSGMEGSPDLAPPGRAGAGEPDRPDPFVDSATSCRAFVKAACGKTARAV